ncbi:MAG: hypothetical protein AB7O44_29250 [Hyphomicrobiaceae bacterium]
MIASNNGRFAEFLDTQAENLGYLLAALRRRRHRTLLRKARREAREKRALQPVAIAAPVAPPAPIALVAVDAPAGDKVVSWVQEYRRRHGRAPQIREVQHQFALSKSTAWRRIKKAS